MLLPYVYRILQWYTQASFTITPTPRPVLCMACCRTPGVHALASAIPYDYFTEESTVRNASSRTKILLVQKILTASVYMQSTFASPPPLLQAEVLGGDLIASH